MISSTHLSVWVDTFVNRRRPRLALGIRSRDPALLLELATASKFADVVLVGPPEIEHGGGWTIIADGEPEMRLARMLANGEVDGLLRGTLDAVKTINAYMSASGETDPTCPALVEDARGRLFFFSAVTNHEGFTREQRVHEARLTAAFMRKLDLEPQIAVYAAVRHGTVRDLAFESDGLNRLLVDTYEDAEWIVAALRGDGYEASNMTIELNVAIDRGFDLHVPVNGIIGNQVVRAFMASGGKMLAAPRIGLKRPYEDNSRTEGNLAHHVRWLTAMANM